jgi:hypothetical protein
MAPENPSNGLPANLRFLLLALGAAIAAGVLYAVFPFLPDALQVFIALAACLIAMHGGSKPNDEKTLASLLCAYIAVLLVLARVCIIFVTMLGSSVSTTARIDLEPRVVFVASCLAAALRLLDGRVSFRE